MILLPSAFLMNLRDSCWSHHNLEMQHSGSRRSSVEPIPVRRHSLAQHQRRRTKGRAPWLGGRDKRVGGSAGTRRRRRWKVATSGITTLITALTAVGALIFTALSLGATRDQIAIAEQGQITDRYSRAIEQLGQQASDQLQIRLGAIYALERLAHDSPRDQPTINEVLATFIRTSALPTRAVRTGDVDHRVSRFLCPKNSSPAPLVDVQAALTVLSRRDIVHDNGIVIDLSRICLNFVNLIDAKFANVNLRRSDLSRTDLTGAELENANLSSATFNRVNVSGASLRGADVRGADLTMVAHDKGTVVDRIQVDETTIGKWW